MKKYYHFGLLLISFVSVLSSCRKNDLPGGTDECGSCELQYKNEKKIKRVSAQASQVTKTTEFTYLHNAIKTIKVSSSSGTIQEYTLYYATGACIPSGFTLQTNPTQIGSGKVDGSFITDSNRVIKRIATPDFGDPYSHYGANSNTYTYDAQGRIIRDVPRSSNAPLSDDVLNISYRPDNNVNELFIQGGSTPSRIATLSVDNTRNPFKQQDYLFYKIKILPFASLNSDFSSIFYYLTLNVNNPLSFTFITPDFEEGEFYFEYTYTPDGYPSHIKVYKADYITPGKPGPKVLQEELRIEYL